METVVNTHRRGTACRAHNLFSPSPTTVSEGGYVKITERRSNAGDLHVLPLPVEDTHRDWRANRNMVKKILLGCGIPLVLLIVIGVVAGKSLLKVKPVAERTETVTRGDVEIKVVETGTIEPLHKVEVKSKAGGRLQKLLVDEGSAVKQGQVLALIDPQEIDTQVAALKAQLSGSQARLAAAEKNVTYQTSQTGTNIDQYIQNAASAEAHVRQLEAESKVQPEMTRQAIAIAQANLDAAKAQLKALQDSFNLMTESTHPQAVVSAQSAYDQAQAQVNNYTHIHKRQEQLLAKGFVSQQAVDVAETDTRVAEANLRQVKDRLNRVRQANLDEEANLHSQIANAQQQVQQMIAALIQAKASVLPETKQLELDSARAAYRQARAQLASARAGRTQDKMRMDDVVSAKAEVLQVSNQLKQLQVQQNDTTIIASMSGTVTKRYAEQGELISSAIASFSSGTPVLQVSDLSTMLIKININEVDIAKVTPHLLTEVTIDAARGVVFEGRVRKVAPAALTDSSATANGSNNQTVIRFPVEIQVDKADTRLKPGMSARCTIVVSRNRNVLRVPTNCVEGVGDNTTVKVVTSTVKDGKPAETVTPRKVKVGLRGDDFVEILDGLKVGEKLRPAAYTGPPRKAIDMRGGPDN